MSKSTSLRNSPIFALNASQTPIMDSGVDAVRDCAPQWFSAYQSAISYEVRDLQMMAGESHAFCYYLYHVTGTQKDGGKVDMWVRATLCLQQIDGNMMAAT